MNMQKKCPQIECNKRKCCIDLRKVTIPAVLGDDSSDSNVKPENGAYYSALVEYEANGALYMYSSDGIPTKMYYTSSDLSGLPTISYVDNGDAHTLYSARSYTDTKTSNATLESKAYADEKDAVILEEAKAYTDTHSGEGYVKQQYVDEHDASTLQSAKDYADQQVNTLRVTVTADISQAGADTLQSAKGYADQQIAQAFADAPVITMTDTDPGEGQPLEANHFIAVYQGGE